MEINAALRRVHLYSPRPQALAAFYESVYGMPARLVGDSVICRTSGREIGVSAGESCQLKYALFEFTADSDWLAFLRRTQSLPHLDLVAMPELPPGCVGFADPDGNCTVFCPPIGQGSSAEVSGATLPASLQHFALRTQAIDAMVSFYSDQLGYVVSDRVHDDLGQLKACFLRTDNLHHAMALFSAPVTCFDHLSYETHSWDSLKLWADHMGAQRNPIVWGVGRHGPGNDVFFMIRDSDGNLVEISSEIEVCQPDRPMGVWRNEERTLNLWGKAIMRS